MFLVRDRATTKEPWVSPAPDVPSPSVPLGTAGLLGAIAAVGELDDEVPHLLRASLHDSVEAVTAQLLAAELELRQAREERGSRS
jgi:hypothetical protein